MHPSRLLHRPRRYVEIPKGIVRRPAEQRRPTTAGVSPGRTSDDRRCRGRSRVVGMRIHLRDALVTRRKAPRFVRSAAGLPGTEAAIEAVERAGGVPPPTKPDSPAAVSG